VCKSKAVNEGAYHAFRDDQYANIFLGSHIMKKSIRALMRLKENVLADFVSLRRNENKYHKREVEKSRLVPLLVSKIGFQMMTSIRVMHCLHELGIPLFPQVASRFIRFAYSAEIHWLADFAPGISLVHGNGLVVSHAATVGSGCILFHNVTLGEGIDPETRQIGAPTLGENVHVGPGATLIGPITVGAGSKIMAGAVLNRSVPPNSIVRSADAVVALRRGGSSKEPNEL
jgi:serine acetyltransferase